MTMKTSILRHSLACVLLAALPRVASAGVYYEARTTVDQGVGKTLVHAWVDGDNARIEFRESDLPSTAKGTYLITRDAGRTLLLVNPKEKTWAEWDLAAMVNLLEGMGGLFSMEFSDPKVEKLEERDGGSMLAHATTYYKYRTRYDLTMRIMGMKQVMSTDTIQEIWTTDAFPHPALGVWLRKEGRSTGNGSLDKLLSAEMGKMRGLPLKVVSVSTTVGEKKGKPTTTRTVTEVLVIRDESVAGERFEIPATFEKVDLLPAAAAGGDGQTQENPLAGLLGGGNR